MNFVFGSEARSYRDLASQYYGSGSTRDYRQAADLAGAFSDWAQDRSGGGCCCGGGYGGGGYSSSPSLFSDGTLFALLAAAGLAFYVLYNTITANAAGARTVPGRRRRRSTDNLLSEGEENVIWRGRLVVSITARVAGREGGREGGKVGGDYYYWIMVEGGHSHNASRERYSGQTG